MLKLILWYRRISPEHRALIGGAVFVLPAVASAIISQYVREYFTTGAIRVQLVIILGMYLAAVVAVRYVGIRAALFDRESQQQRNAMSQTVLSLDVLIAKRLSRLHEAFARYKTFGPTQATQLFETAVASMDHIKAVVEELQAVMESQFSGAFDDPIDFEVTFMTRSFHDGKITIYAWQNRDRRAPISLNERNSTNPDIYASTVTAEVYQAARPQMRIVEDTGSPTASNTYVALYQGQLERIKSSVVYPVLSDRNEILGTLVVHCNRSGFFRMKDARFWRQLLEIYAKRVAYEKICLDLFLEIDIRELAANINTQLLKPTR